MYKSAIIKAIGTAAIDYIKADQNAKYPLAEECSVTLQGYDIALGIKTVTTKDGSLTITINNKDELTLTAHPFTAESGLWNGPDIIPNNRFPSMLASLFHDLIWEHDDELSVAWSISATEVCRWGNDCLYTIWMSTSRTRWERFEAWCAWQACEFSAPWYHRVRDLFFAFAIISALFLYGCDSPPKWQMIHASGTNQVHQIGGVK